MEKWRRSDREKDKLYYTPKEKMKMTMEMAMYRSEPDPAIAPIISKRKYITMYGKTNRNQYWDREMRPFSEK